MGLGFASIRNEFCKKDKVCGHYSQSVASLKGLGRGQHPEPQIRLPETWPMLTLCNSNIPPLITLTWPTPLTETTYPTIGQASYLKTQVRQHPPLCPQLSSITPTTLPLLITVS